jgi:predicted PhzF superfamily epimerase YddE/YHI9
MNQPLFLVDAFADGPFTGNPAAVVPLVEPRSEQWMQSVAIEMNLAETAFVDAYSGSSRPELRWFGIKHETDLCGHATLATAHVLGGSRTFRTKSGDLHCEVRPDGLISMDFPADPPMLVEMDWSVALPDANVISTWKGGTKYLVELATTDEVRRLQPAFDKFERLGLEGVIVTAPADVEGIDIVSRYFHPSFGIPEDPATGSAHCTLASWWAPRLGKTEIEALQLSRRTGRLGLRLDGDRVHLAGRAVTVMEGTLHA